MAFLSAAGEGCTGHWLGMYLGLADTKGALKSWALSRDSNNSFLSPTLRPSRYFPGQFKFFV